MLSLPMSVAKCMLEMFFHNIYMAWVEVTSKNLSSTDEWSVSEALVVWELIKHSMAVTTKTGAV